jgi:ABC-2 type transport system ATP-binding protein
MALSSISFQIPSKTIFGLAGPNGAGKTTFTRLLSGVLNPSHGSATINGHDIVKKRDEIRKIIGVLPEGIPLYHRLSGRETLTFFGKLYHLNGREISERIAELSEELEMDEYLDRPSGEYSHGMKRRLLLARALLHGPRIVLLDEPTLGVDPMGARKIREKLIELTRKKEITTIVTTHDMFMMDKMCDYVAIINKGKQVVGGTPTELEERVAHAKGLKEVNMEDVFTSYIGGEMNEFEKR